MTEKTTDPQAQRGEEARPEGLEPPALRFEAWEHFPLAHPFQSHPELLSASGFDLHRALVEQAREHIGLHGGGWHFPDDGGLWRGPDEGRCRFWWNDDHDALLVRNARSEPGRLRVLVTTTSSEHRGPLLEYNGPQPFAIRRAFGELFAYRVLASVLVADFLERFANERPSLRHICVGDDNVSAIAAAFAPKSSPQLRKTHLIVLRRMVESGAFGAVDQHVIDELVAWGLLSSTDIAGTEGLTHGPLQNYRLTERGAAIGRASLDKKDGAR